MALKEAFAVGVVISAKDMYSRMFSKAERDLKKLSKSAKDQAAAFERNLKIGKGLMVAGGTVAAFSYEVSRAFESLVRTAGENQSQLDRVMIAMGDQTDLTRKQLEETFSRIKTTWGMADEAVAGAILETGGRLGDYRAALEGANAAGALARAQMIDMGTAAQLLTSHVAQFGDELGKEASAERKFTVAGEQLQYLMKRLGGNWEGLTMFLGDAAVKAKSARQDFSTLGAIMAVLGKDAARLRTGGAAMVQILDSMVKLRRLGGWQEMFPEYARTESLVDLLGDLRTQIDKAGIKDTAKEMDWLEKLFGGNADMVKKFIDELDGIHEARTELDGMRRVTAGTSRMFRDAKKQTESWAGVQAILGAKMEEFKEMLGEGAIPMVKDMERALGKVTESVKRSPFWRAVLGRAALGTGLAAELGKGVGPILGGIGTIITLQTQTAIARALSKAGATGESMGTAFADTSVAKASAIGGAIAGMFASGIVGYNIGKIIWEQLVAAATKRERREYAEPERVKARQIIRETGFHPEIWPSKLSKTPPESRIRPLEAAGVGTVNIYVQGTGDLRRDGRTVADSLFDEWDRRLREQSRRLP